MVIIVMIILCFCLLLFYVFIESSLITDEDNHKPQQRGLFIRINDRKNAAAKRLAEIAETEKLMQVWFGGILRRSAFCVVVIISQHFLCNCYLCKIRCCDHRKSFNRQGIFIRQNIYKYKEDATRFGDGQRKQKTRLASSTSRLWFNQRWRNI